MIVRAIDAQIDQWVAKRVTPPRSEGQHVSTVLTEMLKTINPDKYGKWGQNKDRDSDPMWEAGYLWEDVLAKALSERPMPGCHQVPSFELELDGIYGTPDRLLVQEQPDGSYRLVDEEVKFTWMSCKELLVDLTKRPATVDDWKASGLTDDIRFTYWMLQSKTYAAMLYLGGYDVTVGSPFGVHDLQISRHMVNARTPPLIRLRALFVNGAYRGELAIPAAFEIEYTAVELEMWWRSFITYAHQLSPFHFGGEPMPDQPTCQCPRAHDYTSLAQRQPSLFDEADQPFLVHSPNACHNMRDVAQYDLTTETAPGIATVTEKGVWLCSLCHDIMAFRSDGADGPREYSGNPLIELEASRA